MGSRAIAHARCVLNAKDERLGGVVGDYNPADPLSQQAVEAAMGQAQTTLSDAANAMAPYASDPAFAGAVAQSVTQLAGYVTTFASLYNSLLQAHANINAAQDGNEMAAAVSQAGNIAGQSSLLLSAAADTLTLVGAFVPGGQVALLAAAGLKTTSFVMGFVQNAAGDYNAFLNAINDALDNAGSSGQTYAYDPATGQSAPAPKTPSGQIDTEGMNPKTIYVEPTDETLQVPVPADTLPPPPTPEDLTPPATPPIDTLTQDEIDRRIQEMIDWMNNRPGGAQNPIGPPPGSPGAGPGGGGPAGGLARGRASGAGIAVGRHADATGSAGSGS